MKHFCRYLTFIFVAVGSLVTAHCFSQSPTKVDPGEQLFEMAENDTTLTPMDKFIFYEVLGASSSYITPALSERAYKKAEEYLNYVPVELLIKHILNTQVYNNFDNSFKMISAIDRAVYIYSCLGDDNPYLLTELLYLKGVYFNAIADYDNAFRYLNAALQHATELYEDDNNELIHRICLELIEASKETNNESLRYSGVEAMLRLTDKLPSDSDKRLIALSEAVDMYLDNDDIDNARKYLMEYFTAYPNGVDLRHQTIRLSLKLKEYDVARILIEDLETHGDRELMQVDKLWEQFYSDQKLPETAIYGRRNLEKYRKELASRLLFMNSEERRNISKELTKKRDEAIKLADAIPEMTEVALDYSLLAKGIQFSTEKRVRAFMADSPIARATLDTVVTLRKQLTRAEAHGRKEVANNLRFEIASRERYMINDFMDFKGFSHEIEKHSAKHLLANISPNTALVDFVGVRDGQYFVAFVIDGDSRNVKMKKISSRYKLKRRPYGTWFLLDSLINGKKDVYFSTDGVLSSLPLEFLVDSTGTPYSDRYRLHRVFHLSDINFDITPGKNVVAIGISDYNSPVGKGETLYRGSWTDLPAVKDELKIISKRMNHKNVRILFNDDVREEKVKGIDGSDVNILHISTHGFYRDFESLTKSGESEEDPDYNVAVRALDVNKKNLSGLVLRKGNLSWKSPEIMDEGDDLLTAEEIELMSFPNLQLTVLSACDTGLGHTDSEGVWGLQRAFRIAGTKNLICTLSKVDDYWTTQFMDYFYEKLGHGGTIYDSFRQAQKWLRKEVPDNPEIWSSFILIE